MKKIIAICSLLAVGSVQASVVDFQDLVSGNCNSQGSVVISQGYQFTGNPSDPNLWVCNAGVIQSNTSAALIDANSTSIVTMSAVDTSLFSLESFYAGPRISGGSVSSYYGLSTGIEVVGTYADSSTVTELVSFNYLDWTQLFLSSGFQNLASVTFTAQGSGDRPEFLIDDIVVNQQDVPEPASIALLALGLAGVAYSRKKKVS